MPKCYDCQYAERRTEIGPNKQAYEDALCGNTMSMEPCEVCGKPEHFYEVDMNRAIRVSHTGFYTPTEWD